MAAQAHGAAAASAGAGGAALGLEPAPRRGAGASQGRTDSASAQLTLHEASSATHSLCGGRISGKQLQRGSLIRSQPKSAGSSLYLLPAMRAAARSAPRDALHLTLLCHSPAHA